MYRPFGQVMSISAVLYEEVRTHGVPGIEPNFECVLEQRQGLLLVQDPSLPFGTSIRHCPKNDLGDF
jgi:hypothetical protein